jgi:hypothetical protein
MNEAAKMAALVPGSFSDPANYEKFFNENEKQHI